MKEPWSDATVKFSLVVTVTTAAKACSAERGRYEARKSLHCMERASGDSSTVPPPSSQSAPASAMCPAKGRLGLPSDSPYTVTLYLRAAPGAPCSTSSGRTR